MSRAARIQDLPPEERPRERAERHGLGALSDAEVIALLLRTGMRGLNAVELGAMLLREFGGLRGLFRAALDDLRGVPGLGRAKALELAAAIELGNRARREAALGEPLDTPERIFEFCAPDMQNLSTEMIRVLMLDARLRFAAQRDISIGTVNETIAHPREIFAPVIRRSAYAMALVHNHPSGDPAPSEADRRLTRRLADAAALLQIRFLDHVIVGLAAPGRAPFFSFRAAGLL